MIFRIDLLTPTGAKKGTGPLYTDTITLTTGLEGMGSGTFTVAINHDAYLTLLSLNTEFRVYKQTSDLTYDYQFSGIISGTTLMSADSGYSLVVTFIDPTLLLDNVLVGFGREYREVLLPVVLDDLLQGTGWTYTLDPQHQTLLITVRFDGQSILSALTSMVKKLGIHYRVGSNPRELEFGQFGNDSGLLFTQHGLGGPSTSIITNLTRNMDQSSLTTVVIPKGGGEGLAALTIEDTTSTHPDYPVTPLSYGPTTSFGIEATPEIALYGRIERVLNLSDITPLDNTDVGIGRAKQVLYDASLEYLRRHKAPLENYRLTCTGTIQSPKVGDKVFVRYQGLVSNPFRQGDEFLRLDTLLWVMEVTVTITTTGTTYNLTLSNTDLLIPNTADIVVGAIKDIKLANLVVRPYPTTFGFVYRREVDATHTAQVPVTLTDGILYLDRCRISWSTRPFRATASAALAVAATVGTTSTAAEVIGTSGSGGSASVTSAAGGGSTETSAGGGSHNHRMFLQTSVVGFPPTSNRAFWGRNADGGGFIGTILSTAYDSDLWTEGASGTHTHNLTIPSHTHNISLPNHTHDVTVPAHAHDVTVPSHGHQIEYGIIDDVQTPDTLSVSINGIDRTTELGGPWVVGGGAGSGTFEISAYLINAIGGLRRDHTVTFSCESGQGEVEVTVEIKCTVQSIQQG